MTERLPGTPMRGIVVQVMFGAMVVFLVSAFVSIAVNSLALGAMGICTVVLMVMDRRWLFRGTPLDWVFLAYVVAEVIATVFSVRPLQSVEFSKRLLLIAIVYWFASWITTEAKARRATGVLLGTAVAVATIGVGIVIAEAPLRLGIFQFYMTTSELLMFAALLLLPFVLHPATPRRIRWAALVGLVPVLVSLYATVTKGAYLALAAGVVFLGIARYRKVLVPFLVLAVLLVAFAPPYVKDRLEGIVDIHHPENATRLMMWSTGLRMLAAYPVTGVGDIDLHDVYVRYMQPGDPAQHGHLHNMAMQFLVTLGLLGFLAVLAMFVQIARTEWRIYRRCRDDWFRGSLALGALAVFVGLQVAGLTEWTFGDQEVVIVFWISVGLALAVGTLPATRAEA